MNASLSSDVAAPIIRALLDFRTLWTTHDLVTTSGVTAPSVRRVIGQLEREDLVERKAPGVFAVPSWLALLHRWNQDFAFSRNPWLSYWRSKHDLQTLLDRIPGTSVRHAVSGTAAAQRWAPDTPAGPTVIYTPDARSAAALWELVPSRNKTIVLAQPPTELPYTRTRKLESGLRLAAPTQVLSDLLTGAAKSPTAAEPLTHWMLQHELEWRY